MALALKKVLITGSCGFIFGNFIRRLLHETSNNRDKYPYSVVSIDRINGNPNALYYNKHYTFHIADICDQHIIDRIFQLEQPDIVIHGAACTSVDQSIVDPNAFINSNVLGTQVIINACVKHKISKLIYISTDEVLGHLTNENDPPWTEISPLNPRNYYSASKAAGELLVKAAYETYGLVYNITRSSNNYGPRQTPNKLIPRVIKCIINNQAIPIYGQGKQIRDWLHVFDNCSAILTILTQGQDNQIYNISANQEFSNLEVVQHICNAMNKGEHSIQFVPDRLGHDMRYSLDSSKLKQLEWKPQYKFVDGIKSVVEWYQLNNWILKY